MSNWIVSLLVVMNLSAQMDIATFLERVAKENLSIKAEYLKYNKQASTYYTNVLPERPELSLERSEILKGGSFDSANEKNLSITQKFKFPAIYYYKHKTARLNIDIAYQDYLDAGMNTLLSAKQEFITFIILKRKQDLLNEFLTRYSVVLKQMERLKKAGETSEMNLLRISLEYEQLLNEQRQFESKVVSQKQLLRTFLPDFTGEVNDSILIDTSLNKESLKTSLNEKLPFLKRSSLELEQSEYNQTKQYLNRLPDFSFTYRKQDIDHIKYNGFEFGISIPLWIPKEVEEVQVASIQMNISELQSKSSKIFSNSFLEKSWNSYQNELLNWKKYKISLLPKSEKVFSIAQKQYKAGEITYFEFIDNYRVWKNIRLSELDQRLSLLKTQSELNQTNLLNYLEMKEN